MPHRAAYRRHLLPLWLVLALLSMGLAGRLRYPKGAVIQWLGGHRTPPLNAFFALTDGLGEAWAYLLAIIVLLATTRLRIAVLVPLLGASVAAISALLKALFHQPRPKIWFADQGLTLPSLPDHYVVTGFSSFPSGHTFSAFAVFIYLALASRNLVVRVACVALAALGGVSRVYLCQHFLEDVLLGAALGTALAYAVYALQARWSDAPDRWWNRRLWA